MEITGPSGSLLDGNQHWDGMSAEEKKIIAQASAESTQFQRAASRGAADGALDALKKAGMVVSEIPPEETAKLRAKVQPVIDKYSASVGEATVRELMAEVEKARK
ncbi:hypothetical protein [Variovorax gossypii]